MRALAESVLPGFVRAALLACAAAFRWRVRPFGVG